MMDLIACAFVMLLSLQMRQQISFQQGALAPLAASAALFGGFLLIKYLPWINLQTVSNAYFFLIGSAAVTGALLPPFRHAVSTLLAHPAHRHFTLDLSRQSWGPCRSCKSQPGHM